jgi:hypothetical protein
MHAGFSIDAPICLRRCRKCEQRNADNPSRAHNATVIEKFLTESFCEQKKFGAGFAPLSFGHLLTAFAHRVKPETCNFENACRQNSRSVSAAIRATRCARLRAIWERTIPLFRNSFGGDALSRHAPSLCSVGVWDSVAPQ